MFKITVEGDTLDELRANLTAAAAGLGGKAAKAPPADDEPAPKAKPKPKPVEADDDGPSYDKDIRPLILGLSKTHREELLEIFGEFENAAEDDAPCVKGSQVAESDHPALLKKLKALRKRVDAE